MRHMSEPHSNSVENCTVGFVMCIVGDLSSRCSTREDEVIIPIEAKELIFTSMTYVPICNMDYKSIYFILI